MTFKKPIPPALIYRTGILRKIDLPTLIFKTERLHLTNNNNLGNSIIRAVA